MASLDDFSFVGFDGLMPEITKELRLVEIRSGEPTVTVVEDVVYMPDEQSGRDARHGEFAQRLRPASSVVYDREIDEEVIYLGWLFNHYGHFLMQSLARTWFLADVSSSVRVLFAPPSRARGRSASWVPPILEAFGIPPERILVLDAPTRLRRLIIPEPLFVPRAAGQDRVVRALEAMARPYQAVAQRIAGGVTPSAQPLYLSRRLLPPSLRMMVGEEELEAVLRENGFRIAHTETMSFEEQVRLVNEHTDIVSNAGSAVHNVLFACHQPRLHLLTGSQFSTDYCLYAHISAAPTTFINCLSTGERPRFAHQPNLTPYLLDMPTLLAYLDQQGLLTMPGPAASADDDAARRARYDEAWLYGYLRNRNKHVTLAPEIEQEAQRVAVSSWPVSVALAWHSATHDRADVDRLARQFATLVSAEPDLDRLARYRAEVAEMAPLLTGESGPETAEVVRGVMADTFGGMSPLPAQHGRRQRRRGNRHE
jgi:capsular polysaccharide biosynthesis protein